MTPSWDPPDSTAEMMSDHYSGTTIVVVIAIVEAVITADAQSRAPRNAHAIGGGGDVLGRPTSYRQNTLFDCPPS